MTNSISNLPNGMMESDVHMMLETRLQPVSGRLEVCENGASEIRTVYSKTP